MISSILSVIISERLHRIIMSMARTFESVDIANQIGIALFTHHRQSFLLKITNNQEYSEKRKMERLRIYKLLDQSEQYIENPLEEDLLKRLRTAIVYYFFIGDELEAQEIAGIETFNRISPLVDNTILLTEEFIDLKHSQAQALKKKSAKEDKVSKLTVASIVILVFAFALALLLFIQRFIYTPLIKLCDSIKEFNTSTFTKNKQLKALKEIIEIEKAFSDMADRLIKQREFQYHSLAAIAHDLKNPLNTIASSSEILSENYKDIKPEFKNMTEIINRQAKQLNRMVGDLLDVSRIEAGKLELQKKRTDIIIIVKDIVELYKSTAPAHNFKLLAPAHPIYCMIDSVRIGQVISNLISNAIKYSPTGGEVYIEIRQQENQTVITIKDQGIGIKEEEQQQIFEPFMRTKETRETIPGVGLGLSITKRIIDAHQGKIEVKSKIGKGTTFFIYLPLVQN